MIDAFNRAAYYVGYVYLMYYEHEYTRNGKRVVERLYKFGVSNHPERRFKQVQRALPGTLYLSARWPCFDPYGFEKKVKDKWGRYKQEPVKAAPGAGKTEFYAFPQHILVILYIWAIFKALVINLAPVALILSLLLATGHAEQIIYAIWLNLGE